MSETDITAVLKPAAVLPERRLPQEVAPLIELIGLDFVSRGGPAYLADGEGQLIWGNSAWVDFVVRLGRVAEVTPIRLPWTVGEIVAAARSQGLPVSREDEMETGSGLETIRSQHWVATAPDGTVLGVAGSVDELPLTGRLRKQVGALQDRLDDLTRLISDWLWETGPDLVLSFVSARVHEALGYHPREMIGRKLLELGQFIDDANEPVAPAIDAVRPHPFRDQPFAMQTSAGAVRQFRLSGLPIFDLDSGRFRGFRGTARDITAEAAALGMVRSSRRQLNEAIEAVSDGFALFDREERLILCNQRFLEMFPTAGKRLKTGIAFREIMDMAVAAGDVLPLDNSVAPLTQSLLERAQQRTALEYELCDGRWVRATERLTPEGAIVGIRTDITELKRRERALIESKVAAELANRSKSEFLANISHELRTPLNAIIGFSELILSEPLGPIGAPEYREYLADVLGSGRNLLDIINDIIDLAKAEAGQLELNEELTELDKAVEAVLRVMQERALRGNVRLMTNIEPRLPLLRADPRKLRQILLGLVSNGVKFTPPGGTVTVQGERERGGDLLVKVIDNGIGIAEKDIETALRPFGQIDAALSRKYSGAGLGLPLTRAMVELHDGTIALESREGAGTTVTVRFPASRLRR